MKNEGRDYYDEITKTGDALAEEAYANGARLTDDERMVLTRNSRFGSASYPVRRLGRGWTVDNPLLKGSPIYPTKFAAIRAWEIIIAKLIRMSGLEARDRVLAEEAARGATA